MNSVLFLVHRVPTAPDKGDRIRSFHLLKFLAARHRVHLGAFVDAPADWAERGAVDALCASVCLRPAGGLRSALGAGASLFRREALGVGYYRDRRMRDFARGLIRGGSVDAVIAFSSTMAQYGLDARAAGIPFLVDFVDVDSDKWRQYAANRRFPASLLYRYEAAALGAWERRVAALADAVTLVSGAERDTFDAAAGGRGARVEVVRNGVDTAYFDPAPERENPYPEGARVLVFTGAMDYYANEDAVTWFADEVWDEVAAGSPGARFHVVGRNPTAAVRALGERPGITVEGGVPDMRPYLAHAALAVAPLRLARGVQNKILEALAMNLPVVAAPQAVQGLDGRLPDSVRVAAEPREFANATLEALARTDAAAGDAGRSFVETCYDWDRNLSVIDGLLDEFRAGEAAR